MLNLTLHVPTSLAGSTCDVLLANPHVLNVTRLRDACAKPEGDRFTCMVPRESVARLLEQLAVAGFDERVGTITLDEHLTVLGTAVERAQRDAAGAPADALVWPALRASTSIASEFSFTYLAFMVLATVLAAIGLLTSSSVLIVGAMILGPEFGALAHLCVSALGRDLSGIRMAIAQLLLGFTVAITATSVGTWLANATGLVTAADIATEFERAIVSPTLMGFIIAGIAGTAGVLTLTSAKGEALIGVLVSVTTIPAAADLAIGIAAWDGTRALNGLETLLLNLSGMVVSGATTLVAYRLLTRPAAA